MSPLLLPLFAAAVVISLPTTDSSKIHFIHWNSTNPIFRIDKTDYIFDVNVANRPGEYDRANLICPTRRPGMQESEAERYIIYSVTKEEYDSCRITNPHPKVIAQCNNPDKPMWFTLTFRSFTPTPGAIEFHPGHDYYFISTSKPGDLHRREGGRCSTHNMKVMFKVAKPGQTMPTARPTPTKTASTTTQRSRFPSSISSPYQRPGSVHTPGRKRDFYNSKGDDEGISIIDTNSRRRKLRYKNGVIKQEASRMQSDETSSAIDVDKAGAAADKSNKETGSTTFGGMFSSARRTATATTAAAMASGSLLMLSSWTWHYLC